MKRQEQTHSRRQTELDGEKERQRQEAVKSMITMKLNEMRQSNIPEAIVRNVERKLNINSN